MDKKNLIISGVVVIAAVIILIVNYGKGQPKTLLEETKDKSDANTAESQKTSDNANNNAAKVNNVSSAVPQVDPNYNKIMNATIKTSLGEMKVELYGDKTPITAGNFAKLAEAGFYNGIKFHRVIKGFMIQGGDPLTKDDAMKARWGTGGPGYQFADEKFTGEYKRGILAMANSGPNTNGSQFFIMHQDYPLPPSYVIFGKVTSGIEVVDKIAELPTGANDQPVTPPVIESVTVEK
ncbi:MAG: peptidylprolyl isomerase [Candidatus Paceibacterota bacterium]